MLKIWIFLSIYKCSFSLISIGFNNVWATLINRASGTFRDERNRANPNDSHLVIILVNFDDFGVFGGLEIVISRDFHVFCKV